MRSDSDNSIAFMRRRSTSRLFTSRSLRTCMYSVAIYAKSRFFSRSPSARCLRSHGPGPKQLVGFMSVPRVHRGIRCPVPCFMLEAFPEKAQSSVVVPFDRMPASIRPRYISSKNRNSRTISTYIHPDFINDRWHTGSCPICSGTSGFRVFAIAHKAAGINTAITSRQQCVLHSSCKSRCGQTDLRSSSRARTAARFDRSSVENGSHGSVRASMVSDRSPSSGVPF